MTNLKMASIHVVCLSTLMPEVQVLRRNYHNSGRLVLLRMLAGIKLTKYVSFSSVETLHIRPSITRRAKKLSRDLRKAATLPVILRKSPKGMQFVVRTALQPTLSVSTCRVLIPSHQAERPYSLLKPLST